MDSMKEGEEEEEAGEEVGIEAPPEQEDAQEEQSKAAQEGGVEGDDTPSGISVSATIGMVNLLLHSSKGGRLASVDIRGTVLCWWAWQGLVCFNWVV